MKTSSIEVHTLGEQIAVGSVVRLNGQSQIMTVTEVNHSERVECAWFDSDGYMWSATLPQESLEKIINPSEPPF